MDGTLGVIPLLVIFFRSRGLTNSSCTMPLLYSSMVGNVVLRQIYRKSHGKTCLLQDTLKRSMMFLLQAEHSNSHIQPCKT